MKKFRRILALAVLLAVSLLTLAMAEEKSEILIDSSRNAAIKIQTQEGADGLSGTFSLGGDVVKGLVAGAVDLKFSPEQAKELGDLTGALYYSMTDKMEVVGSLDMAVPPDVKELSKANANIESVASSSKSYAKGDFSLEGKSNDEIPAVDVDGSVKGNSKEFDGKVNFSVDAGDGAAQLPFKTIDFSISEKDASTTISLGGSVDAATPYARNLKQIGQNPDMIKNGVQSSLQSSGITVESVDVGEYKEENGVASAKLSITLKGWREAVQNNAPMMGSSMNVDGEKMKGALTQMLEAKFDSITFNLKVEGKTVKGELAGKVSNARQLALGYYHLASMITEAQLANMGESADPTQRFVLAYQAVAMDEALKAIQAAVDADMGFDVKGKMKLAGEGEDKKNLKMSGDFTADFSNYSAYITKAQAAGLPAPKNSAFKFVLGMAGQGRLTGSVYGYSDSSFINYYKKVLISAARKGGAPEETLALAEKVEFKSSAGSVTLSKDGVKGGNYLESNDLTPLFKAIISAASSGKLQADLTGFNLAGKTEGEKLNIDGMINFAKFMEGKSAAEIKEALDAPSSAVVKEDAKPEEVKLVAVTKPEVAMPDSLKTVAADGQKLIASSPIAAVTGALGGGGNKSMLYILAGLAAIGVVGVGVAAGRKKG